MRGRGSDDVALEVDQAARGTSGNHHEERVCKAEVARGTGRERLTSTGLRRREGPGGEGGRGSAVRRLLYGGQTPELLRRLEELRHGGRGALTLIPTIAATAAA